MDFALVTVRITDMQWQVDMELPAKMRIQELQPKILEVIKNYDDSRFSKISSIRIQHNGTYLNEESSLADYKLWDGSVLDITYN